MVLTIIRAMFRMLDTHPRGRNLIGNKIDRWEIRGPRRTHGRVPALDFSGMKKGRLDWTVSIGEMLLELSSYLHVYDTSLFIECPSNSPEWFVKYYYAVNAYLTTSPLTRGIAGVSCIYT